MSNMSYCRFQNTSGDLQDCIDSLEDGDWDLSPEEVKAAAELRRQAEEFMAVYDMYSDRLGEEDDDEEEEPEFWCPDCEEEYSVDEDGDTCECGGHIEEREE